MSYYILRDGTVSKDYNVWKDQLADPEKKWVRRYENDRVKVEIEWVGGPFSDSTPQHHAAPYKATVWNILTTDPEGNPLADGPRVVKDPQEGGKPKTEKEAVDWYEDFLVKNYTGCEWIKGEDGLPRFIERNNRLAPISKDLPIAPPPESVPQEIIDAMGSW